MSGAWFYEDPQLIDSGQRKVATLFAIISELMKRAEEFGEELVKDIDGIDLYSLLFMFTNEIL